MRRLRMRREDRLNFFQRTKAETMQPVCDVRIIGLEPKLTELIRRGALRIESHRARCSLSELGAIALGQQRPRHTMR